MIGVPVVEIGVNLMQSSMNQMNTLTQQIQDYSEYGENIVRWKSTLDHWQQQVVKVGGLMTQYNMPKGAKLEPVNPFYLVPERCNGGERFNMDSILKSFTLDFSGDYLDQQRKICSAIQQAKNSKLNYTVEFMSSVIPKMQNTVEQLGDRRNANNEEGTVSAAIEDATRVAAEFDQKFQAWQANVQAADAYIQAMEENQKILAGTALQGKKNPIKDLVKTAVLVTTLCSSSAGSKMHSCP
ncbi:hypothetical protein GCM10027432_13760 [Lysobacter fragariae]